MCVCVHAHVRDFGRVRQVEERVLICMPYFGNFGKIGYLGILFLLGPEGLEEESMKEIWD